MTISSTTNRVSYSGNGSTTVFSFPYNFFSSSDLVVISRVNSTGVETVKTLTTHYTVTGAGVDGGGSVTMLTAPASGTTLIIYRDTPAVQSLTAETDFFDTSSVEDALDRQAQVSQRLASRMDRAVRLTEGHPAGFDPKLPEQLVANAVLAVKSDGTGFEWGPDQDELLDAATAAAASEAAAAASAAAASSSAGTASTQASNAANSASAAATSATNASNSASAASTSATNASNSASAASTSASNASTSETNASTSASAASTSATNASNSASAASTSATNASNSASAASTSATNASNSASAAATSASNAATSETNAAASAAAAAGLISDTAYNATTWDGVTTIAPSKNAVRDQFEAAATAAAALVSDTAYNATTWDSVTTIAPSKNAVRDQFEAAATAAAALISDTAYDATSWDAVTSIAPSKNAVRDKIESYKSDALVFTNKDIDGGTASNSNRLTVPKNTKTNLDGLTRKEGTILYGTDTGKFYRDNGSSLAGLGGGGGGSALMWIEDANAPLALFENNSRVYAFESGLAQLLYATIRVPLSYTAGDPINLRMVYYNADTSGNALITAVATLVRTGTDLMSSTTNQRTSTNAAVTMSGATQNIPQALVLDLTSSTGTINSVAVAAGDIIKVSITRGSDTATSDIKVPVFGAEVTFS